MNLEQIQTKYNQYLNGELSQKEYYKQLMTAGWYGEITEETEAERVVDRERKGY